ncbi:MAG: hypothetical protein EOP42_24240, partial [Sphingobacteriaceae bacterium]
MKKSLLILLLSFFCLYQLRAQIVTNFSGNLTTANVFVRPKINGGYIKQAGPGDFLAGSGNYNYLALKVVPSITGNYAIKVTGGSISDTYILVYQDNFTSTAPLTNLIAGNDDDTDLKANIHSVNLIAGSNYYLVATSFANNIIGSISFNSTGPSTLAISNPTPAIVITPASLPAATVGSAYNQTLAATGGSTSYNYLVTTGILPPGLSLSLAGLISGVPAVTGSSNFTVTATDALSYTGTQNYTIDVNKTLQTITFNPIPAKTYGDTDFDPGATASSGLAVTYTSSDQTIATIVNNKVHIAGTGTVNITASQAGDNNNDAATAVTQSLTVNKASLTITANDQSKTYGTANPELTAGYTGFVYGETSNNLTTKPAITTSATTISPVGSYPINVTGAVSANYQINYVSSSLAVYPGIQTITFTTPPKTYGEPDFPVSATASSGLPITYSSS